MINKKLIIVLITLIALSLIITIAIYNKLPEQIPMHYNVAGEVDRYGNKETVFLSGLFPLMILFFMIFLQKFDKKNKEQYEKNYILYNIVTGLLTLFIIAIHWIGIFASVGYSIDMRIFLSLFVGILFAVIGGFIDKVQMNNRLGIKIPTTLNNEENWTNTHKLAHYTFIIGGILSIISAFLPYKIGVVVFFISIAIVILVPIIYSINKAIKTKKAI